MIRSEAHPKYITLSRNSIKRPAQRYTNFTENTFMKKLILSAAVATFSMVAAAQQEPQPNDDQLQQQAPRETQVRTERAAKIEAVKAQSNAEIEAERAAKEKGQTQRQTKAQPVGINPDEPQPRELKPKKPLSEETRPRN